MENISYNQFEEYQSNPKIKTVEDLTDEQMQKEEAIFYDSKVKEWREQKAKEWREFISELTETIQKKFPRHQTSIS